VLLGGPEVAYEWEEIITLPQVDLIILGEGEIPFTSFLNDYPCLEKVPALVWKRGERIFQNPFSEITSLQHLEDTNPYMSIPSEEFQHKISYIEASRGCPNCCEFCLAGLDNNLRYLPLNTIQANLLHLMEHGKVIKFLDRTFNSRPAFAIAIFQFILENYKPGNVFQFEIKADKPQPELTKFIEQYVPKGIFRFEIGIQTLNAQSNKEVKRKQNFRNIKTFMEEIAHKVEIHLDLIVGLPYDYFADIKYSFEEVFKLFAPELQLGFLKFLKGTPIRQNSEKHRYKYDPLPPYQIIESKYLSNAEIGIIEAVEQALDIYWNKKRTLQTLKYVALNYSIFDFLHGLGVLLHGKFNSGGDVLTEIYTQMYEYSIREYPGDELLVELLALDYYLNHKVKPRVRFLPEIKKVERNEIIESQKLNHHKYRYIIHKVHFSTPELFDNGVIKPSSDLLIIEYSGVDKPRIVR
jgi:anaerobic magnesium-protoporphyrin IX monomethyl ester cyclase